MGIGSALMGPLRAARPAQQMARQGRFGDSLLAHLDPMEAALLKAMGGAGTTHPKTGALEFWSGEGDSDNDGDGIGGDPDDSGMGAGGPGPGGFGGPGGYGRGDPDDTSHAGGRPGGGTPSSDVGVGGGFASDAVSVDDIAEAIAKGLTKADLYGYAQKAFTEINQSVRDRGISVVDGVGDDGTGPGASDAFGGGDQGNDVGGGSEPPAPAADETEETSVSKNGTDPKKPNWAALLFGDRNSASSSSKGLPRAGGTRMSFGSRIAGPARQMAQFGRDGDTLLAHINPSEAQLLKALGGRGTINPVTGALEFATRDNFDAAGYLARNADVAGGGYTAENAWDHYNQYGRTEGRTANAAEEQARSEGYQGKFGVSGEPTYVSWKTQQLQDAGALDQSGGIRRDLTGGNNADNLQNILSRIEARERGYAGDWGSGGYNAFKTSYYDHDNDPSTKWVADNDVNIDRAGRDVTVERQKYRDLGFDGTWGGGDADQFIRGLATQYGVTGDISPDAIRAAKQRQTSRQADQDAWTNMLTLLEQRLAGMFGGGSLPTGALPSFTNTVPPQPFNPFTMVSSAPAAPTYSPARSRMKINPWTGAVEYENASTFAPANSNAGSPRRRGFGSMIAL